MHRIMAATGVWILLASFATAASAERSERLSFERRVQAQVEIERVYHAHRIGERRPFEQVMPTERAAEKVRAYLAKSRALEFEASRQVTARLLDAELARIVRDTRHPDRLRELFAALGDDPVLVRECLVRPVLVDRLSRRIQPRGDRTDPSSRVRTWTSGRQALDSIDAAGPAAGTAALPALAGASGGTPSCTLDDTWNNGAMDDLPDPRYGQTAIWTGAEMIVWGGRSGGPRLDSGGRYDPVTDSWSPVSMIGAPVGREQHSAVWTGSAMVVWGGAGTTDPYLDSGGRYDPATDTWAPTSLVGAPPARRFHTAVWTGTEMVVWGGDAGIRFDTGGRYDPVTDTWAPTSTVGAPSARHFHVAAWSGSEMIVWGGYGGAGIPSILGDGARYDPVSDSWSPVALAGAPSARLDPASLWTGNEMVVWGGSAGGSSYVNTGGRYDPVSNTWSAVSTSGAPTPRRNHTAIWDGARMLVWGGDSGSFPQFLDDGGRYDPVTDGWSAISAVGMPAGRRQHSAIWTGSEMVVWGGTGGRGLNTGGRYDPVTDLWTPTFTASAPLARADHTAVWTGNVVVVWGGTSIDNGLVQLATGGRYDPTFDQWTPTSTTAAPVGRTGHSAVWTGSEMVVWGGRGSSHAQLDSGGRYDPVTDSWAPTSTAGAPTPREQHTGVWTGTELVVWGGVGSAGLSAGGGRYDPIGDVWQPTSSVGAPQGRVGHTAVWTGDRMVVWGGYDPAIPESPPLYDSGGRYDPSADTWSSTTTVNAPSPRRGHTAVWTGSRMVVWGGADSPPLETFLDTGGRYDPSTDSWGATTTVAAPAGRRDHGAAWIGSEMIVWGGTGIGIDRTGGRYDPSGDVWRVTSAAGAPSDRTGHTATWTGGSLVVWGGTNGDFLNNGGRYVACVLSGDPPQLATQWGVGPGPAAGQVSGPHGIAVAPNGDVYVADTGNSRVQRFSPIGEPITQWGSFGSGDGQFNHPHGIGVDADGNVFVAETGNNRVQKFTADGTFVTRWGSFGSADGQFLHNHGLAVDRATGHVYVADRDQNRVQRFTSDGVFVSAWGSSGTGNGQFSGTNGVAVDAQGHVFVGDSSPRIQKFTRDGAFLDAWGSAGAGDGQFSFPRGLSVDANGNVYVADRNAHRMQLFTGDGTFITKWGTFGAGPGEFNSPYGIAAGHGGVVFVADSGNSRIQTFAFVSGHSGHVPNGGNRPGPALRIAKDGPDVVLDWGPSCRSSDDDYAVYEGVIGDFTSHLPVRCGTAGATTTIEDPGAGSSYYLVVPRGAAREGSYGVDGDGVERPASTAPCSVQVVGACG